MAKRKSDEQYQDEMHRHSQKAIDLLREAKDLHQASLVNGVTAEHLEIMKTVIAKQREGVGEMKKATRIQHTLMKQQIKRLTAQQASLSEY